MKGFPGLKWALACIRFSQFSADCCVLYRRLRAGETCNYMATTMKSPGEQRQQARAPLPTQDSLKPKATDRPTTRTSRLIVKGLPKYADEKRLKDHFSTHGQVTDVKVMRTRQGVSRLFGFVGFASVEDAEGAQRYYNRTFMDASKLEVEFAQRMGSEEGRRNAWSKYTDGTSRNKELVRKELEERRGDAIEGKEGKGSKDKKRKGADAAQQDPKLQEFLALMQPRHKKAVWANDDEVGNLAVGGARGVIDAGSGKDSAGPARGQAHAGEDEGSDGEYEDVGDVHAPSAGERGDDARQGNETNTDIREEDVVVADKGVSDLEYMKARMTGGFSDDEDEEGLEEDGSEDAGMDVDGVGDQERGAGGIAEGGNKDGKRVDGKAVAPPPNPGSDKDGGDDNLIDANHTNNTNDINDMSDPIALISKSSRLFLRNLPYSANEDDIREFFEPGASGGLDEVHIITDKVTRKSKGYALVMFEKAEDAVRAFEELDGSIFMGRLLHILPGKVAPQHTDVADGQIEHAPDKVTSSFKREKDEKLKDEAKSNKVAWNSLFMRADTVADAVADMYSMTKADLLDPSASDMAVRLALGEVKVINMTKEYLEEQGINIRALEAAAEEAGGGKAGDKKKGSKANARVKRSDATLIIKNLPFALDEDELKELFSRAGPILRWILPPSHTMAVVEFSNNQDASKAFKTLAFKRYRSVPIYLEWAPRDIFDVTSAGRNSVGAPDQTRTTAETGKAGKPPKSIKDPLTLIEDSSNESFTIFVKNLAFKTKKAALEKHFRAAVQACGGEMRSAKISQRKKDNKMVSAGFGFVECSSESVAKDVVQKLQGSALDGHNLVLQLAANKAEAKKSGKSSSRAHDLDAPDAKPSTKLVVRNLAFEATRQDVLNLFAALGEVKSCRLPRKFDGSHRGFAFVDFASAAEAKTAITSISGTHLYGRRLVLEFSEASEEDPDKNKLR